jgi:hypothetical protein
MMLAVFKKNFFFSFILGISYRTGGRLVEGCPFIAQFSGEMLIRCGVSGRSGPRP